MSSLGKIALVTGASRGLGRATALELARNGAAVAIHYRNSEDAAHSLAEEINGSGGQAYAIRGDMGIAEEVRSTVARAEAWFGAIDILVNNAGVSYPADLDGFDEAQMNEMRRVNVDAVIEAIKAVAPGMKKRGFGRIVNMSSAAAIGTRMRGTTFYAATKAAVIALTRRFAMELGPYGITVNAIAPGFIVTDMSTAGRAGEELQKFHDRVRDVTMMRRLGCPEDIGCVVAFLASNSSGFLTAQVLTVDGGRMDYIGHA